MQSNIEHTGIIIAQVAQNRYAVKIEQHSACASCHAASLCTAAESKEKIIEATACEEELHVGMNVIVYGKKELGYKAVLLAVIIPLFLVLITLLSVTHYTHNELMGGVVALVSLLPYYCLLAIMRKKIQHQFVFYIRTMKQ